MLRPTPSQLKLLSLNERIQFEIADAVNRVPILLRAQYAFQVTVGQTWVRTATRRLTHLYNFERLHALAPDRGVFFVCNHRSFFDFYVISAHLYHSLGWLKKLYFPVRSNFFYDGPLGTAVNAVMSAWSMYPPILRGRDRKEFNQYSVAFIEQCLQSPGVVVGYHPEGTRSKLDDPYTLLPAQVGTGSIIHGARPIVIPVFTLGLINDLPKQVKSNFDGTGQPVTVVFGEPLDLDAYYAQPAGYETFMAISERVRDEITALGQVEKSLRARDGLPDLSVPRG